MKRLVALTRRFATWFLHAKRWQQAAVIAAVAIAIIAGQSKPKPERVAAPTTTQAPTTIAPTSSATPTTMPTTTTAQRAMVEETQQAMAGSDDIILAAMSLTRAKDPTIPSGKAFDRMLLDNVHQICATAGDTSAEAIAITLGGMVVNQGPGEKSTALAYGAAMAPTYCPQHADVIGAAQKIIAKAAAK
jgi:hypothetical protein